MTESLGSAAPEFISHYGMTDEGNFEGRNILFRPIGGFGRPETIDDARQVLLTDRAQRSRPGLDDKILTEWNGLLLASLSEAAAATGSAEWTTMARQLGQFLVAELRGADRRWLRSWQSEGGARHLAYAQDHAALIDGFTRLYELTGEAEWLRTATETRRLAPGAVLRRGHGRVLQPRAPMPEALLTRPKDLQDNATPSPQSTAAFALRRLAPLADRADLAEAAEAAIGLLGAIATDHPNAFAHMLRAAELAHGLDEIVVVGRRPTPHVGVLGSHLGPLATDGGGVVGRGTPRPAVGGPPGRHRLRLSELCLWAPGHHARRAPEPARWLRPTTPLAPCGGRWSSSTP